jgi:peroxiredoxin
MASSLDTKINAVENKWLDGWKQGPTHLRWTKIPLQAGDKAPDLELEDAAGGVARLSNFWKHGPAVLLFWRHYGCSCGIERARRLKEEYEGYIQLGASVVVIGQGEPERAALYASTHGLPCPVLCDPDLRAYEAYDLLEGKPSQILFDAPDEFLRCDYDSGVKLQQSRHNTFRALVDNPWMLPYEFVVDRQGTLRLAYRYQYCEAWPDPRVLVAGIKDAIWANQ